MKPVVELCGVSVQFAAVQALRQVDLAVEPGQIVTVIGESGCGKSTLGKTLLGLNRPARGQVLYDGQDIWRPGFRMSTALRLSVQTVHQDSYASLNPVLRVGNILSAPLRKHRPGPDVRARVLAMLERVGLSPPDYFANKYPFQLSGGQRQRVSLARAALLEPRLIVADEPVSGVDATLRLSILELMRSLNQEGIAFVYITHDLATARYLGRGRGARMAVMYLGRIVEWGPVDAVLDRAAHPYLAALLAALPPLDPRQARRAGPLPLRSLDMPNPAQPPPGCSFHLRCPYLGEGCADTAPELTDLADNHQVACYYPR